MTFNTLQSVFDYVYKHLLKQNCKSIRNDAGGMDGGSGCAYRGDNNTSCAAGCLIKDEFYSSDFENRPVFHSDVQKSLEDSGVNFSIPNMDSLLAQLQIIHDSDDVVLWKHSLLNLAKKFNLTFPETF